MFHLRSGELPARVVVGPDQEALSFRCVQLCVSCMLLCRMHLRVRSLSRKRCAPCASELTYELLSRVACTSGCGA